MVPFFDQTELAVLSLVELQPRPGPPQRRVGEPRDQALKLGELGQGLVVDHPPLRDLFWFDIPLTNTLGENKIIFAYRVPFPLEEAASGFDKESAQKWLHTPTAKSAPLERQAPVI